MGFYLGAETEDEATVREVLEVPGGLGDLHRGAGERDGDGGADIQVLRLVCGYGEREERVMFGLAGPESVEAQFLGGFGGGGDPLQVLAFGAEPYVELHRVLLTLTVLG